MCLLYGFLGGALCSFTSTYVYSYVSMRREIARVTGEIDEKVEIIRRNWSSEELQQLVPQGKPYFLNRYDHWRTFKYFCLEDPNYVMLKEDLIIISSYIGAFYLVCRPTVPWWGL